MGKAKKEVGEIIAVPAKEDEGVDSPESEKKPAEFTYKQKADSAIRDALLKFECQPILFVGSGISLRYIGAPAWLELLEKVHAKLPPDLPDFDYLVQKFEGDPLSIGSELAEQVFEWAWNDGKEQFSQELFSKKTGKDIFFKELCCKIVASYTKEVEEISDEQLSRELAALREVKPHAVITTNYDLFLEKVFDGYETITGQTIIKYNTNSFGEIFHIHGDVSDPSTIVITQKDYDEWIEKKKYVSAKLLTYFAEHPVFLFGYSIGDPNVKAILKDIGELVSGTDGVIDNVYQVVWHEEEIEENPSEFAIIALDDKEYRIRAIHTNEFRWIFDALRSKSALTSINPKLVRALAARTMRLIRHDIPGGTVDVDYDVLERVAEDNEELPKLLGITMSDNPNKSHPYTLSQVAQRLDMKNWQAANKLLNKIKDETGTDLRSSDNRYHCKIKTGVKEKSATRKWSHEAVSLLEKVRDSRAYKIEV